MNAQQLNESLSDLGISRSELAQLLGVTTRAVNLWCSGDREIPGPTTAYLTLFKSLPRVLRSQELARIQQEQPMQYDGMYAVEFVGREGNGICALVMMDGYVFGHDGGVIYDGIYESNQGNPKLMDLKLNLTVPVGVSLVLGVPAQPAEYRFPLEVSILARGDTQRSISTPFGPVQCKFRFLRTIPTQLAA